MKNSAWFKYFSLTTIWIWLGVFAIIPTLMIVAASFLSHSSQDLLKLPFTFSNYEQLFNIVFLKVFWRSLTIAFFCTLICLLIGYPFAYGVARTKKPYNTLLLLLIMIPFWTSSLIRTYAIMTLLKSKGLINSLLLSLGLIHQPLELLYSKLAVFIGLSYDLLPFMILPLYASIEKLDNTLIEAAHDLGAKKLRVFFKIIVPLTMPGIISGSLLVFLPAMTLFYIPVLLGGAKSMLLGNLIENQFLQLTNWPVGSASSTLLIVLIGLLIFLYLPFAKRQDRKVQ